jgi:hypothetical protein
MKSNTTPSSTQTPRPDLSEARKLHRAGLKLCKLHPLSKRPVGDRWNVAPISDFDPKASGYGVLLAANGLASIDPDMLGETRKAFKAVGFDLDALMRTGVRSSSTRPGSGGRSTFSAPDGCGWVKFRAKFDGRAAIVFELRALSPNLQDVVPGLVYKDTAGNLCTQRYTNGRTLKDAPAVPGEFAQWWRKLSSDRAFRREQENMMARAIGADVLPDLSPGLSTDKTLPFPAPGVRMEFNARHKVADLLAKHGYRDEGSGRWSAPDASGAPGVRPIRGKQDLWQSDHGSDPLHGTFDAWAVFVVYEHGYDVGKATRAANAGAFAGLKLLAGAQAKRAPEDALPTEFMVGDLDTMIIPPTRWLVDGLIAPGLTILAAPPKQGKSYLALQTALCAGAGVDVLERATQASRVTYFDLEEWHGLLKERVDPIRAAHKLTQKLPVKIKLTTGTGEAALRDMEREVADGSRLIIVDIFAKIRDELSENAKQNAYARDIAFVGTLAQAVLSWTDTAVVVVHHGNKGKHDDWQSKISGSSGITGASHTNIYMARPDLRGMNEDDKREAMRYRTLHAIGKQVRDQEIAIEMLPNMGGWKVSNVKPWEISVTRKQKQIVDVLRQHAPESVSSKDLAAILGARQTNVRQMCYQMVQQGVIASDGRGGDGYRVRTAAGGA